jgi:hypothetical protein
MLERRASPMIQSSNALATPVPTVGEHVAAVIVQSPNFLGHIESYVLLARVPGHPGLLMSSIRTNIFYLYTAGILQALAITKIEPGRFGDLYVYMPFLVLPRYSEYFPETG